MIIQADEESLQRMLGVEPHSFPPAVIAEYELRLQMFHGDGHSGPIGTVAIIDMLRSMKLGPRPRNELPKETDWVRMPKDGSVTVEAYVKSAEDGEHKWVIGTYLGIVGVGTLAVRLDGASWVHEFTRKDVRIAREKPPEPVVNPVEGSWEMDEPVLVEDGNTYLAGVFKAHREDGKIMILVEGKERSRAYAPECVARVSREQLLAR
jgi:hypothetical protein